MSGRLNRAGTVSVSFSWLYHRIRQDRSQSGSPSTYMRQRGKAILGNARHVCILGCWDISERHAIVDSKQRSGDWEADTILGKASEGAAVTLVERKSKYPLAQTLAGRPPPWQWTRCRSCCGPSRPRS